MNTLQEERSLIEQQYREILQKLEGAEERLVEHQNSLEEKEAEL